MDEKEREFIRRKTQLQLSSETYSEPSNNRERYQDMSEDQKLNFIDFLMKSLEETKAEYKKAQSISEEDRKKYEEDRKKYEEDRKKYEEDIRQNKEMLAKVLDELKNLRLEFSKVLEDKKSLQALVDKQGGELAVLKKNHFSSTSLKSNKGKKKGKDKDDNKPKGPSYEEKRGDFDGTKETSASVEEDIEIETVETGSSEDKERLYRKGLKYKSMKADEVVFHRSDKEMLPEGAVFIKSYIKPVFDKISKIVEHDYEIIVYKTADGKLYNAYMPLNDESVMLEAVPGTSGNSSLLANECFNHYVLNTTVYREQYRFFAERLQISSSTIHNWFKKAAGFLGNVTEILKQQAFANEPIINCDETWLRVKCNNTYIKKYLWCLVNKAKNIVLFEYIDGSRARKAFLEIIENSHFKALQSDGYIVYDYLNDPTIETEHLCCMAHARAKFQYAVEAGDNKDAESIVRKIGELYKFEANYKKQNLSPEEVYEQRQSLKTKDIVGWLRSKIDALKSEDPPSRGSLMTKAIKYMDNLWNQLFAYLKDGNYCIDNSIAEQNIRPLSGERKNSLFYANHKMASVSATFHTVISTCHMQGISSLEYLHKFFNAIAEGRRDYENLLPMTIGITNKNY